MDDRGNRRSSGNEPQRIRGRRGCDQYEVRSPRRPRLVNNNKHFQQTKKPQRRSVRSVLAEVAAAKEFTPCLGINPAMLHRANNSKYTGLHNCCKHCTPHSKRKYSNNIEGMCGLIDVLNVDMRRFRKMPYRVAPYLSFVAQQPIPYLMNDHRKHTLSSKCVQEAITDCVRISHDAMSARCGSDDGCVDIEKEQVKRAANIVSVMSSAVYSPLVRIVAWLLFWAFGKLFGHLYIQQTHIGMLLNAQERGVPLVFLPNHKSHMDYLIMTFVLFSIGVKIPRVAAGDNLRLPFVSWLITHLGGFFIKRKLDTATGKDILYRKCLHEYMERSLSAGENLEFFLEGSRSRSGKPCTPKAGLLSVVVDAVKEGIVEDVLVVPVNISYDRIIEKNFVKNELMGEVKKPETLRRAMKGVWSILTRKIGAVRVDISQPFSLQEYLSTGVISKGSLLELTRLSRGNGSPSNSPSLDKHRKMVTALSYHIMYDITQCTSLTPTGIVAFLLLNKYRQHGATVDELITSYLQLEKVAVNQGRVISSYCAAGEAVHYALHHLYKLVTVDNVPHKQHLNGETVASSNQKVYPLLQLPDIFDLYHLSNQVISLIIKQAIVARSIIAVAKEVKHNQKNISRDKVIKSASFLSQIMAREFIFIPPCEELTLTLQEVIDDFVNSEVLNIVVSGHRHGNKKLSYLDMDDDDDDDWLEYTSDVEYKINSESEGENCLGLFSIVLEPFIECYWLVTTQLLLILPLSPGQYLTETGLVEQFQKVAKAKAENGQLSRIESCSSDTIRNAIKILQDMQVLIPVRNGDNGSTNLLEVANSNHLVYMIKQLNCLC